MTSSLPLIAIVGRPNVGKSALFNRLTRSRRALVEKLPGTTRDRQFGDLEWRGHALRVVDTGGMEGPEDDPFSAPIEAQVREALAEADVVLFLVDGTADVTAADEKIASLLRRGEPPVRVVVNKGDRATARHNLSEFYSLGFGEPILISAYHGEGIGDLLDAVVDVLPAVEREARAEAIRVAIVGRPNVGKSSLVNAILGEERAIVSAVPGTTRDAIDSPFRFEQWPMVLVDTAGIRRRGKIERGVERHAVQQAERAIARADVVLLLLDQTEPATAQDTHISSVAIEHTKGLVLVVNKWDLAAAGTDRHTFARRIDRRFRFIPWAPVQLISALTGDGIVELLQLAVHIETVRRRRIQTSELNRVMHRAIAERPPPTAQGRRLKILYVTQAEIEPPTFVFFVNDESLIHFSYRRFLENRLRAAFGFEGTAIRMRFRSRVEEPQEVPV